MPALRITIDSRRLVSAAGALRFAATAIHGAVLAQAAQQILVQFVRDEAPVKSGRLRDSIVAKGTGTARGVYSVYYGPYVAEGTKPHLIRPSKARVLVFQVGGKTVFARQVNHPGTKANDFPRRAVDAAKPALQTLLLQNGRQLIALTASRA